MWARMRLPSFLRPKQDPYLLGLFSASDVHSSGICWGKFVGAGCFYSADALVMGGDLTGKAVVSIAQGPDGRFSAEFLREQGEGAGIEPKTLRWKARARIGERVRWCELPDEDNR